MGEQLNSFFFFPTEKPDRQYYAAAEQNNKKYLKYLFTSFPFAKITEKHRYVAFFGFICWFLREGLCGGSWLPTPQSSEMKFPVCGSCTAWAGIAFWQHWHTQAIPRASLLSLSNNSAKKGEGKAWNSSLIQFQEHFLKAEAAAAFWSETSIAGGCPRK